MEQSWKTQAKETGAPRCGNLSSFLRQKKELKVKKGISSTIRPRGVRSRKRGTCLFVSFPVPSPISASVLFAPTNFPPHFSKPFRCFYLWKLNSLCQGFVIPFFFVNSPAVSARNKHLPGESLENSVPSLQQQFYLIVRFTRVDKLAPLVAI